MDGMVLASRGRWILATMFILFLLVNVVVVTTTFVAVLHGERGVLPPHLGQNVAFGLRLGLMTIGGLAGWCLARMLYRWLVVNGIEPSRSVGPALSLFAYLLLIVAAYSFLGFGTWLWMPVLFLIVLVWSVITLLSLLGVLPVVLALIVAVVGVALTWYFIAYA